MAVTKGNGSTVKVQPAHLRSVSIAYPTPLPATHPPPELYPIEFSAKSARRTAPNGNVCLMNVRTRGYDTAERSDDVQKAHLYEAILFVNRGIDDAVRGLERLKRAKDSGLTVPYIDEKLTLSRCTGRLLPSLGAVR